MDPREQLFNELAAAYPSLPQQVILEVMHKCQNQRARCLDALNRRFSESYQREEPSFPETRPRANSGGNIASNRPYDQRVKYTSESRHFVENYPNPQYDPSRHVQNLTIEEERPEQFSSGMSAGSMDQGQGQMRNYNTNFSHAPNSAIGRGQYSANWPSGAPSRPQAFEQVFPVRNGDLRESTNTPSPNQPPYCVPQHQISSNFNRSHIYPASESDQSNIPYQAPQSSGALRNYTPQPHNTESNYTTSMFISMGNGENHSSAYAGIASPSQHHYPRNVPQSLPLTRSNFSHQSSSDNSPSTPGKKKAITPGMYGATSNVFTPNRPSPGHMSGSYLETHSDHSMSPGHFSHVPSSAHMIQSPNFAHHLPLSSHSEIPGPAPPIPHTSLPVSHSYVNQPAPPPRYIPAPPPNQEDAFHHGDWSRNPQGAWHDNPPPPNACHSEDSRFHHTPPDNSSAIGQSPNLDPTAYRKSSLGEDAAYMSTLLEHQTNRRAKLQHDLQERFLYLTRLKQELQIVEKEAERSRQSRTIFIVTADDVQKKKQENKKLQMDIHLLTMRIDAATTDNQQFLLGVLDSRPQGESNFYSNINPGQHDRHLQHTRRTPPPRPPPPSLPPAPQPPQFTPLPLPSQSLPPAQPQAEAEQGEQWACTMCTFKNHPALDKCEMCEMPRMAESARTLSGFG